MKELLDTHKDISLKNLLRSPYLILYATLYMIVLALLFTIEGFNIALPIFVLLFIGIGFSSLAWWSTKRITPPAFPVKKPALECGVLVSYLIFGAGFFLVWGMNFVEGTFPSEGFVKLLVVLAGKLIVFVVVPLLIFRVFWGYRISDLADLSFNWKKHLRVVLWMSLAMIPFQLMLGSGLAQIQQAEYEVWQLAIGMPVTYLWIMVSVGLVEEIPYRILLQSRLAAVFRSEVAGLVMMLLLFGLTHAPGLYFRTGETIEAIGPAPSPLMAIGYSIVIISVVSFFLGILWIRTKNLVVLVLVHAMFDLIPKSVEILEALFVR